MKTFLILGEIDFLEHPYRAIIQDIQKVIQCTSSEDASERGEYAIENGVHCSYLVLPTYKGEVECKGLRLPADFNMLPEDEKMMRFENALVDYISSVILPPEPKIRTLSE